MVNERTVFLFSRPPKPFDDPIAFDKDVLLTNILFILVILNIAGLMFTFRSIMQSVTALTVGWVQVSGWLIEIARNRSTPVSNKRRAFLGILTITTLLSFWAWFGIKQENTFASVGPELSYSRKRFA